MLGFPDDNDYPRSRSRIAPGLKLLAIVIVSITLMMVDNTHHSLAGVRGILSVALEPIQIAAGLPDDAIDFLEKYIDRGNLIRKNHRLSQKVLLLEGQLEQMAALQAENERIRALMASASTLDRNVLIARILSVAPEPYRQYVKLNKGSADGVFVGQALIDAHGIVGQVTQVTPLSSRAMLITDPNTGIPVQDNNTGLLTIAQGTGNAHRLSLPFLTRNADIHVGDLLVSSGLGGRYPANYPVARVSEVNHRSGSEFLTVYAEPVADLHRGREILLIWDTPSSSQTGGNSKAGTHEAEIAGSNEASPPHQPVSDDSASQ